MAVPCAPLVAICIQKNCRESGHGPGSVTATGIDSPDEHDLMTNLHAELVLQPGSRGEFARLARAWLTEARAGLFPEFDRVLAAAGPSGEPPEDDDAAWGPPGGVWARLLVRPQPQAIGGVSTPYSQRAWRRLFDGLDDLEAAGIKPIVLSPEETAHGAVETYEDAKKCAALWIAWATSKQQEKRRLDAKQLTEITRTSTTMNSTSPVD